jgi:hypothetical protein
VTLTNFYLNQNFAAFSELARFSRQGVTRRTVVKASCPSQKTHPSQFRQKNLGSSCVQRHGTSVTQATQLPNKFCKFFKIQMVNITQVILQFCNSANSGLEKKMVVNITQVILQILV